MANYWFLRLHRWLALTFSLPIAAVLLTGFVLSFEPLFIGRDNQSVTAQSVLEALKKHDPENRARSISINSFAGTAAIGTSPRNATVVDLATNEKLASAPATARFFSTARRIHETLLLDLGWLVTAATIALVLVIALGTLMGLPMLRNNLSGWHKATAWFTLPLLILSPMTGLMLAFGITFAPPLSQGDGRTLSMTEAVEIITQRFPAHQIVWIRNMGGRQTARIDDGGELRVFRISGNELVPAERNWPRLLHEGTWSKLPAFALNMIKSFGLALLLVTGVWIWLRRSRRRKRRS